MLLQTPFEGKMYSLRVDCGPAYPNEAPTVKFMTKINLAGVNPHTGYVSSSALLAFLPGFFWLP
ncbi:MAG: hypothetical protein GY739_22010, partial [Mesoflavibacter sp.]|nr:hypothetical protein [Mesoflavibacter sp.]